jgi:flagellar biosynthesis protein FlhF
MMVKRYEASSLEEALAQVKRDLGPEALILSTQQKRRSWLRGPSVEVVAAKEAASTEAPKEVKHDLDEETLKKIFPHRRAAEMDSVESLLSQPEAAAPTGASLRERRLSRYQDSAPKAAAAPPTDGTGEAYVSHLSGLGFSEASAKEIARRIIFDYPKEERKDPGMLPKIRARVVASSLQTLAPSIFDARTVWTALGVGGAGKTASLVKLAIGLKRQGYQVSLIGCDQRKVVGQRELATYARLIKAPYSSEFRIDRGPKKVQLIDTPALSFQSPEQNAEIAEICRGTSPFLVLDATARLKESLRIWEAAARFQPAALVFTRLDLVSQPGVIHDILKTTRLPILGASLGDSFKTPFQWYEARGLAEFVTAEKDVAL